MLFLIIGVVLLAMKYLEMGPVALWPWWVVFVPFGLSVVWWWWADASGYTKRKEIEKMERRKQDRIDKQRDAMGMLPLKGKAKKKK